MIFTSLTNSLVHIITAGGYFGIFFLNLISNLAIPIPSEVILPFSGFLVSQGKFNLFIVIIISVLGALSGSSILYAIGYFGGRPLIEKYGKYILIKKRDLDRGDQFFQRYGDASNFIGRLLPIIRSFISFPVGVARMSFKKFIFFAFLATLLWNSLLTYLGYSLAQNWDKLAPIFHKFDYFFLALIVLVLAWFIYRHRSGWKR